MFIQITNVVKQRLIRHIKSRLIDHPDFHDVFVSNKMPSTKDLPAKAIIISGASGTQKRLDLSDHIATATSRAVLARTVEGPSTSIEWVTDNLLTDLDDVADSGYYYTKILSVPTYNTPGTYEIIQVFRRQETFEPTLTTAPLAAIPLDNKLYVYTRYEGDFRRTLVSPAHYVYDSNLNEIVLSSPMDRETLVVEYYEAGQTITNIPFSKNSVDPVSLPGIVIAFGERIVLNDQQVVYVSSPDKPACYDVSGGQYDLSFDVTCFAQDPGMQERLVDYVSLWLWEDRVELERDHLILNEPMSLGGEATDLEVSISNVPYFQASLTVPVKTNWEIHIPRVGQWRDIGIYDLSEDDGTLPDDSPVIINIKSKFIPVLDITKETQFYPDMRIRLVRPGFLAI
jgi:hypothetical protein